MFAGEPGYIRRWSTEAPLRALLLLGFCIIAWLTAYYGLLNVIEASQGRLDGPLRAVVAFAVALIQGSIVYFLLSFFSGTLSWWLWPPYLVGYAFLTLISVALTFAFFWGLINASAVQHRVISESLEKVDSSLLGVRANLDELRGATMRLAEISAAKAQRELTTGRTCPNSPPGDGQRRRLRLEDAARFREVGRVIAGRRKIIDNRLAEHAADLARLRNRDSSVIDSKTGTHRPFVNSMNDKLRETEAVYNALSSDPIILNLAAQLETRANQTEFVYDTIRFRCPDPALQSAINSVVSAMKGLPEIEIDKIRDIGEDKPIFEAVHRLVVSIQRQTERVFALNLVGMMPDAPQVLPPVRKSPADISVEQGLSSNDYGPLGLALLVDMMLFLLASRGISTREDDRQRMGSLVERIHAASDSAFGRRHATSELLEILHSVQFRNRYAFLPYVLRSSEYATKALFLQLTFPELEAHRIIKRLGSIECLFGGLSEPRGKEMLRHAGWGDSADDIRAIEFYRLNRRLWQKALREVTSVDAKSSADAMSSLLRSVPRGRPMNTQVRESTARLHADSEPSGNDAQRRRGRGGVDPDLT